MLKITGLTGGYSDCPEVVRDVSFQVNAGERVAIIGPNGCGKSTLLKLIAGVIPKSQGQIILQNALFEDLTPNERSKRLSYLPQSRNLPDMDVETLVLHGRFPYLGYPRHYTPEDKRIVEQAMLRADVFENRQTPLAKLSGGQRQKAYLAMLMAQDTPLILLDEPTTYLDMCFQFQLMELITGLKSQGKTVITVLHDLNLAMRYSDYICLMQAGETVFWGSPDELCQTNLIKTVFGVTPVPVKTNQQLHYLFLG